MIYADFGDMKFLSTKKWQRLATAKMSPSSILFTSGGELDGRFLCFPATAEGGPEGVRPGGPNCRKMRAWMRKTGQVLAS